MRLMQRIRDSIKNDCFPKFIREYVLNYYSSSQKETIDENSKNSKENCADNGNQDTELKNASNDKEKYMKRIPEWVMNALKSVNVNLLEE